MLLTEELGVEPCCDVDEGTSKEMEKLQSGATRISFRSLFKSVTRLTIIFVVAVNNNYLTSLAGIVRY